MTNVLERTFRILESFRNPAAVLSLADLTSRTGIPKATVHRLVQDLLDWRALERTSTGFRLGVRLFELGGLVHLNDHVREVSLPFMSRLYEITHQIVHLGVLDRTDVLYIEKLCGPNAISAPTRVAGRMPLHCTALGKALLAHSDPDLVEHVLDRPLAPRTPYTVTSAAVLRQQLDDVARHKIAYEYEESALGLACVSSPILGPGSVAIAAISVSGPMRRIDHEALGRTVRTTASAISFKLSEPYPDAVIP